MKPCSKTGDHSASEITSKPVLRRFSFWLKPVGPVYAVQAAPVNASGLWNRVAHELKCRGPLSPEQAKVTIQKISLRASM